MKKMITIMLSLLVIAVTGMGQSPFSDAQDTLGTATSPRTNGKLYEASRITALADTKIGIWQWRAPFGTWADMTQSQVEPTDVLTGDRTVLANLITPNPYQFTPGVYYQYRIRYATGGPGNTECYSDIATMQFTQGVLAVEAITLQVSSGRLQWTLTGITATNVSVEKSINGSVWVAMATIQGNISSYQLPAGFDGYIRLVATTTTGATKHSSVIRVKDGAIVVPKLLQNPVTTTVTVMAAQGMRIIARDGRVLCTSTTSNVNVSQLPAGNYFIIPLDSNGNISGKALQMMKQ